MEMKELMTAIAQSASKLDVNKMNYKIFTIT